MTTEEFAIQFPTGARCALCCAPLTAATLGLALCESPDPYSGETASCAYTACNTHDLAAEGFKGPEGITVYTLFGPLVVREIVAA
jgi:hypothetical protein